MSICSPPGLGLSDPVSAGIWGRRRLSSSDLVPAGLSFLQRMEKAEKVRLPGLTLSHPQRVPGLPRGRLRANRAGVFGAARALTSAIRREQNLGDPAGEKEAGDGSRKELCGPYLCRRFLRFLVWFKADLDIFRSLEETSSESEKRAERQEAEWGVRSAEPQNKVRTPPSAAWASRAGLWSPASPPGPGRPSPSLSPG